MTTIGSKSATSHNPANFFKEVSPKFGWTQEFLAMREGLSTRRGNRFVPQSEFWRIHRGVIPKPRAFTSGARNLAGTELVIIMHGRSGNACTKFKPPAYASEVASPSTLQAAAEHRAIARGDRRCGRRPATLPAKSSGLRPMESSQTDRSRDWRPDPASL
jgi:hypothetical protein